MAINGETAAEAASSETAAEAASSETVRTFSQADVDRMRAQWATIQRRKIQRASDDAIASLITDLGFADIDDLRGALSDRQETQGDADKVASDLRRATAQIRKLTGERDQALQVLQKLQSQVDQAAIKDAVFTAAKKMGAYEEETFALLQVQGRIGIDDGQVYVRDPHTGESVPGATVEMLVKELTGTRKNLLRSTPGVGGGSQAPDTVERGTAPDLHTREGRLAEVRRQLAEKGIIT